MSSRALYDTIGRGYRSYRTPDPRIAAQIHAALGDAATVVNVGAGAGSYEPTDRSVTAVEPSAEMIAQRPAGAARVVKSSAESLPFDDDSFDAALAILTIHHWSDAPAGLRQMRRVARDRIVIVTWDHEHPGFWISDYFPRLREVDDNIFLTVPDLEKILGPADVTPIPIPHDCTDGFLGAYWRRPSMFLDPGARQAISTFSKMGDVSAEVEKLEADITSGVWAKNNAGLLEADTMDLGYRLLSFGS